MEDGSMIFPGHNYLGPGNSIENGRPVDEDDRIAQIHDLAYNVATSNSDIRSADISAIYEFLKDFITTGNLHSLLGCAGIVGKYILETVVGVQYPRDVSRKKHNKDVLPGKSTVTKSDALKDKVETSGTCKPDRTSDNKDGYDVGISVFAGKPGSSTDTDVMTVCTCVYHTHVSCKAGKPSFKHHSLLYSKGYQLKSLEAILNMCDGPYIVSPLVSYNLFNTNGFYRQILFRQLYVSSLKERSKAE